MSRRLSIRLLDGIEAFQFDARIRRAKLPIDRADSLVPMLLPTLNLLTEFLNSRNIVGQALPRQHTQFDLGNIEPTRMLRGVVDLQTVDQRFSLFRRKDLIKRSGRVGNACLTVSGLICSIYSNFTIRSARSSSVQRCRPSGALLHAR